jgi:iron transport multicopper oxidase
LVYTPAGKSQLVFLASAMNIIRTVDAVTGTLINQRQVQPPFLQSDIGCTDIPNFIGIIGTPILDPNTDTVYFFSKGYQNNATSGGVALGRYLFFAIDINTLADKPGFPVDIDNHYADNDNTKYFDGGTVLQRPSLAMVNGVVIGGFGGHCDLFNYTGMLVAVSTTQGVGVTSIYAMEGGPAAEPETNDINNQAGGKAGIWQGGMGLATDNSRIFFATGNGQGHANGDTPASGRVPLTTLDEVVADFAVSSAGNLTLTDYFEPYEYVSMDAADKDLGSGGVALLDSGTFKGTGVSRIAVSVGKNGKAYILNADNLGGFKQGPGGTDNILQTIIASGSVFGGSGSYPLEGGYIYFTPIGFPTVCYKFGLDGSGKPIFTLVGQTKTNGAGRVGIGIPTITSYQGQAGTGILWVTDPSNGLQAFNAVPDNTGTLTPIPLPATGGLNKFQRPAFGDGRVYVSDVNGHVYCLGSPVALPLNCTPQPVSFGDLAIGSKTTVQVSCTALIPITKINGCTTGDATFICSNSSLPQGSLAQGAQFTFPVTWDLTQSSLSNTPNASYGKVIPGAVSTNLDILTTNGVPKYSTILPINLQGNTVSQTAFLSISPGEVDFGGIVVDGSGQASGLSAAVIVSNIGLQILTFTGFAWTNGTGDNPSYTNLTTNPDGSQQVGVAFSSISLPAVGSTLAPGASVTIPLNFNSSTVGSYQSILEFWSDGGNDALLLAGSASTSPVANISVSTVEGGWDYSEPVVMDFGNVLASTSASRDIQICNSGGSALTVTKSKPPIDPELFAARPLTDLHEGQTIDVNTCALGEVDIVGAAAVVNQPPELLSDVWTLNTDGINPDGTPFGVHEVTIMASITRRQIGPLLSDGTARYKYLGCYLDVKRILPKGYPGEQNNDNAYCQTTCLANGYIFAGTEYRKCFFPVL